MPTPEPGPPVGNRKDAGRRGSQTPPLIPGWIWWLMLLAAIGWNAYVLLVPKTPPTLDLRYSDFLAQLQSDNVASVELTGQNIQGTFRQPITAPPDQRAAAPSSVTPPTAAGTATPPTASATPPTNYSRFSTIMPATGDDQLLPLLKERKVQIAAQDTGGSGLLQIALNLLPTLVLIGLLVMMGRQAQRGQQSLFGFGASKARLYTDERPKVSFTDVAGQDGAKLELAEIVDFLKGPERYRALGARLPRGVLLLGPPGTGKTLLARAVAGEAGVPFLSINGSEFVEMLVGVGASRVRDLFQKAKAEAPAILFIDEIDAVGRARGGGNFGGNEEREQTLNQLLVEMDGFDEQTSVIVMAATNRPDVLDPALLRPGRFDRHVTLGLPDRNGREAILRIHTRRLQLAPDVDLESLARRTPGFSGADLANLANEAALFAARRRGTNVVARDFDDALDSITLGTKQASVLSEAERKLVAYHEGGHALVARLTPGADPVNKVTIIPHGRALGLTEQLPEEDRHSYPRDYLVGRLTGLLGGRAAEDLVFGQPTTGAESDLKQATALARRMVSSWGMSEELGLVSYAGPDEPLGARPSLPEPREYADATAAKVDRAVRALLEEAYDRAKAILTEKRPLLDALANELLTNEIVDSAQLDALLGMANRDADRVSGPDGATPTPSARSGRVLDGQPGATP